MVHRVSVGTISVHECVSSCAERGYVSLASGFLSFSPVHKPEWRSPPNRLAQRKTKREKGKFPGRENRQKASESEKTRKEQSSGDSKPLDWSFVPAW